MEPLINSSQNKGGQDGKGSSACSSLALSKWVASSDEINKWTMLSESTTISVLSLQTRNKAPYAKKCIWRLFPICGRSWSPFILAVDFIEEFFPEMSCLIRSDYHSEKDIPNCLPWRSPVPEG